LSGCFEVVLLFFGKTGQIQRQLVSVERCFEKGKFFKKLLCFESEHVHCFDHLFFVGNVEFGHLLPHFPKTELPVLLALDYPYNRHNWLFASDP